MRSGGALGFQAGIGSLASRCACRRCLQRVTGVVALRQPELHIEQLSHQQRCQWALAVCQNDNTQVLLRHQADLADHAVKSAAVGDQFPAIVVVQDPAKPIGLKMSALALGLLADRYYRLSAPHLPGCGSGKKLLALVESAAKLEPDPLGQVAHRRIDGAGRCYVIGVAIADDTQFSVSLVVGSSEITCCLE